MPLIDLGRALCNNLEIAQSREWLVTNGLGGYASGTVSGAHTRRYHGLLIAALKPPVTRTLLLSKLDETATYHGQHYPLYTNRWGNDLISPAGYYRIERFYLEGTTPVWVFACSDALLEKRIWMQPHTNTTIIRYDLVRASAPMQLHLKALVNYRDHHGSVSAGDWRMQIDPVDKGIRVTAFNGATPFYVLSDRATGTLNHTWNRNFYFSAEAYRGLNPLDDNLHAGDFRVTLQPGESVTLAASTDPSPNLDGIEAYKERQAYESNLLHTQKDAPDWVQHLTLAADQFIVCRPQPDCSEGHTVIAGYPWFGDWGRDTMISLPGLTLTTGQFETAASILRTFAQYVDKGMLPNRLPEAGETPPYNTADATLWYFEALRAYHAATGDDTLIDDLFPVLQDIIKWHIKGTRYHIHVDSKDGLLHAGGAGTQLTWMDAKVGQWVVTPRIGKPVDINALWYNALNIMVAFAQQLGKPTGDYQSAADKALSSFSRFWNEEAGFCYDVLDGDHEADLRPNQLLAVSLPYSPLDEVRQKAVVDTCAQFLLTSYGLRTLSPEDPKYIGHYGGNQQQRDGAYHQGTVWSWLIGPFIDAHLRVYHDPELAQTYIRPLISHLEDHGIGSISEIFDGDSPFIPRGCIAQAWGVAGLLHAWQGTNLRSVIDRSET